MCIIEDDDCDVDNLLSSTSDSKAATRIEQGMVGADKDALSIEEFLWKFTPLLLLIDHCRDVIALRLLGNLFDQLGGWRQIEHRLVGLVHNGLSNKQAHERFAPSGMQLNDKIAFS